MRVDDHELRSAFGRFLDAKRALRQAYRRAMASHPDQMMPVLQRGAFEQAGNDSPTIEDLQELKDENEKLRKSLTLLHAHSMRIQERLDALHGHGDERLEARASVASRVPKGPRADEDAWPSAAPLDGTACESTIEARPDGWTAMTVSAGMTG